MNKCVVFICVIGKVGIDKFNLDYDCGIKCININKWWHG